MANHLTPAELADAMGMKQSEVIERCVELGVPIFQGKVDKTLFSSSLRSAAASSEPTASPEIRAA